MLKGANKNNWIEASFTIVIYFFGIGIFGYLVKHIGTILDEMEEVQEHKKQ